MGNKAAITLTPGDAGILKVTMDGQTIFDRHAEDGKYPEFTRVGKIKGDVLDHIKAVAA